MLDRLLCVHDKETEVDDDLSVIEGHEEWEETKLELTLQTLCSSGHRTSLGKILLGIAFYG